MSTGGEVDIPLQHALRARLAELSTPDRGLPLDDAVVAALPKGTVVQSCAYHGFSSSQLTLVKIAATDAQARPTAFFVKYVAGTVGFDILRGESEGMKAFRTVMPSIATKMLALGTFTSLPGVLFPQATPPPSISFYVAEFLNLQSPPPPDRIGRRLAQFHLASMTHPSNPGAFGFHVPTYNGRRLQPVFPMYRSWSDLWSAIFMDIHARSLKTNANDPWPELTPLMERVRHHLVPRLIGPDTLREPESRGGGPIRPALLHGDIWGGNEAVNQDTGDLVIFDPAPMWGHHEMDVSQPTCVLFPLCETNLVQQYFEQIEPSEPKEECGDRSRLYTVLWYYSRSTRNANDIARQFAFDELVDLVEKYVPCDGADGADGDWVAVAKRRSKEDRAVVLEKVRAVGGTGLL